jgi:predicted dehydrogenase
VVGCGGIAFQMHGHAYKAYAGLRQDTVLAACCDIDGEKARKFKESFGFRACYTDYREMLKTEKPDAVCLNAPVKLTAELASAILEEGYPLILEKPPGKNREETLAIMKAAAKGPNRLSAVPHQVAFNRRFIPVLDALVHELRLSGGPENIQNISCEFFRINRRDPDFATTAIHGIDTVRYVADSDYEEVHFFYQELPSAGEGVCNVTMECRFVSGAAAQLRFCPMTGITIERLAVNAGNDTFFALLPYQNSPDAPGSFLHYRGSQVIKELNGADLSGGTEIFRTNGFYQEDAAFFDAIREGREPAGNLSTTLQSVELEDCIRRRVPSYHLKENI